MWHEIVPYVVPLVVLALILRRGLKSRPSKLRLGALWLMPVLIALATASLLAGSPPPTAIWIAGFIFALALGLPLGWLRARHMEIAVDPETGTLTSKATPIGTLLVVALFLVRFALKLAFPQLDTQPGAHPAGPALLWTDAALLFSTGLVWGRAVTTWLRARPLLLDHRTGSAGG